MNKLQNKTNAELLEHTLDLQAMIKKNITSDEKKEYFSELEDHKNEVLRRMKEADKASKVKPGYIVIWAEGIDSFISNAHGFCFDDLEDMNEQLRNYPEDTEDLDSGIHVLKPQKETHWRQDVGGYEPGDWLFEKDDYCKEKAKELRQQTEEKMKEADKDE